MDGTAITLQQAAQQLGVSLRTLQRAVFEGRVPAPPQQGALTWVSPAWVGEVGQHVEKADENIFGRVHRQKVKPFARYEGTSAWKKHRRGSVLAERAKALGKQG